MGDGAGPVPTDSEHNRRHQESDDPEDTRIQYLGWNIRQSKAESGSSLEAPYRNGYGDLQWKVGHRQETVLFSAALYSCTESYGSRMAHVGFVGDRSYYDGVTALVGVQSAFRFSFIYDELSRKWPRRKLGSPTFPSGCL